MILASFLPSVAWLSAAVLLILFEIKLIAIERRQKARLRHVHGFVIMFILVCLYGSYNSLQTRNWDSLNGMAESIWKMKPASVPMTDHVPPPNGAWIFYYVGGDMSYLHRMDDLPSRPSHAMRLVDSALSASSSNLSTIVFFDLFPADSKSYVLVRNNDTITLRSFRLEATFYDVKTARWLGKKSFDPPQLPADYRSREITVRRAPLIKDVLRWMTNGK